MVLGDLVCRRRAGQSNHPLAIPEHLRPQRHHATTFNGDWRVFVSSHEQVMNACNLSSLHHDMKASSCMSIVDHYQLIRWLPSQLVHFVRHDGLQLPTGYEHM